MTTPDELRDRIARADPARDVPTEPITGARARLLLEDIMKTPTHLDAETDPLDGPASGTRTPGSATPAPRSTTRRWWYGAAAAAAVAALAIAGAAIGGAFDGDGAPQQAAPPLQISAGEGQDPMAMCIQLSPEVIAQVPLAFEGTATAVDGEQVTLDVDRWYVGGDAATVQLSAPAGMLALTGGIDFEVGQPYIIAAYDGVVAYCGLSGPATPELQSLYDTAFPG
jgi:hypothetical protein